MSRWRMHLLGVEQLTELSGGTVDLPDICWPLLGTLLAAPNHSASRAWIANELWPEAFDDVAAKHRLGTALWRIRARFKPSQRLLRADKDRISLRPGHRFWVDALVFELRARQALAAPALDSPAARTRLARALALYRGDLLADRHNESVALERERLRALFIDASYLLATAEARAGRWQQARDIAQRLCEVEPLREDAQRLLIEAHAACGNRAVALRQYRILERLLAAELAVPPMPDTVRLHDRIAAEHREPMDSLPPFAAAAAAATGFRAALVSVRDQITRLITQYDALR